MYVVLLHDLSKPFAVHSRRIDTLDIVCKGFTFLKNTMAPAPQLPHLAPISSDNMFVLRIERCRQLRHARKILHRLEEKVALNLKDLILNLENEPSLHTIEKDGLEINKSPSRFSISQNFRPLSVAGTLRLFTSTRLSFSKGTVSRDTARMNR